MTAPAVSCTVRAARPDGVGHPHPLATRTGMEQLAGMVSAYQLWKPLTWRCRNVLSTAYRSALAGAKPGDVIPLPAVPDGTHRRTVAALERRGLVADGALTPLAVEVVRLAEPITRRRKPIVTAILTGGLL